MEQNPTVATPADAPAVTGAFKVDTRAGEIKGEVSSQWFSRPDDQKFLSLNDLHAHTKHGADNSRAEVFQSAEIEVRADSDDTEKLELVLPNGATTEPTNWSFGQACSLVQAPAGYMRRLPGQIAAINLQHGLMNHRSELVKTYTKENGSAELRAITGPDYGRIHDHELVEAVQRIAGNGTGDERWKIPGMLDWSAGTYNPFVDVTKETTTLFASDRDVFLFLVDDTHPIEIGKTASGEPDLVFRGFYAWNSEVGSRSLGLAAFYLRGVCQNRMLWGVENFQQTTIRHSKGAPGRFIEEIRPALNSFANASDMKFLEGVKEAKSKIVASNDDERAEFLTRRGFTKGEAAKVIDKVLKEEGKPARSVWDFVQGITAEARSKGHQDARLDMEKRAGKLLDQVA